MNQQQLKQLQEENNHLRCFLGVLRGNIQGLIDHTQEILNHIDEEFPEPEDMSEPEHTLGVELT